MLFLMAMTLVTLSSCKNWPGHRSLNNDSADSTMIAERVEAIINPQFSSVDELIEFRQQTEVGYAIDSTFRVIPEDVLKNVAEVMLKKGVIITKKSVVEEYRAHNGVYDNLPVQPSTEIKDSTKSIDLNATDLGTRQDKEDVFSTTFRFITDTIDGKPVKVQIKEERSYVK